MNWKRSWHAFFVGLTLAGVLYAVQHPTHVWASEIQTVPGAAPEPASATSEPLPTSPGSGANAENVAPGAVDAPPTSLSPALPQENSSSSPAVQPAAAPKVRRAEQPPLLLAPRPAWADLTSTQQSALEPLKSKWEEFNEVQRREWVVLSNTFDKLSEEEQHVLRGRMRDWAALSVQQRLQARISFAQSKKLGSSDKKAQWEAYQALSAEEKKKLAKKSKARPAGAATAPKPVPEAKFAAVPPPEEGAWRRIKIETRPDLVEPHTLLPKKPPRQSNWPKKD